MCAIQSSVLVLHTLNSGLEKLCEFYVPLFFKIITVEINFTVLWDVMPCGYVIYFMIIPVVGLYSVKWLNDI